MIGGSSSINGLIFIRGQHEDFDDWARAGRGPAGATATCCPISGATSAIAGGESQYHGAHGEFDVSRAAQRPSRVPTPGSRPAQQFGLPPTPTSMARRPTASGAYQLGIGNALAHEFGVGLPASGRMTRPNLTVMTDAHVGTRRLSRQRRAVGVEYRATGKRESARRAAR